MFTTHRHGWLSLLTCVTLLSACDDADSTAADGATPTDMDVVDAMSSEDLGPDDAMLPDTMLPDAMLPDATMDALPPDAPTCDDFCGPDALATINACLTDEPIDVASCLAACEAEDYAPLTDCISAANLDCDAAEACFGTNSPVSFEIDGTDAIMRGVIDVRTIAAVQALIDDEPQVERIVLLDCPGSMDDESNLRASRLVRAAGLATHVPADGVIASGAVDFFTAGVERTADVEGGAQIGVHAWGNGDISGADVPRDDPQHRLYLDYYAEMGIPADFYWFTLDAAPPARVHWMTTAEVDQYELRTQ